MPQLDFIVCLKYLPGMRSHMSLHFKDSEDKLLTDRRQRLGRHAEATSSASTLSGPQKLTRSKVRPYSATCWLAFVLQPGHTPSPTKARVLGGVVQACMVTPRFRLMSVPVVHR